MHVKNCATIRRSISRWALSLFGVMASISSMNNRQGAFFCENGYNQHHNMREVTYFGFVKSLPQGLLRFTRHTGDD